MSARNLFHLLFDPRGRADRRGLLSIALFLLAVELLLLGLAHHWNIAHHSILALSVKGVLIWVGLAATARRLHDLGLSALWILGGVVGLFVWSMLTVLSLLFSMGIESLQPGETGFIIAYISTLLPVLAIALWLHLAKGEEGPNRFGPQPGSETAAAENHETYGQDGEMPAFRRAVRS